ncbi:MAG: PstS family phosphate ABC transporter substrate-binding protein [Cyanobacteria bacterium]|nr:PstS family phosphate ABC transporter substrate-binding protein [Cyanobacteriota bacterium]MDA1021306.1 PstS family phosphate ABC transporter substrate-binding protein [Cyanobacteriota bacterium]
MVLKSVDLKQKILLSILDFSVHIDSHRQSGEYSLIQISEMLSLAIEINNLINALDKDVSQGNIDLPELEIKERKKIKRSLELFFRYKSDLNSISIDIGENLSQTNRYLQKGVEYIFKNLAHRDFKQVVAPRKQEVKTQVQPKQKTNQKTKKKAKSIGVVAPLMFMALVIFAGFSFYGFFFDKSATRVSSLVKEYRSDKQLSSVARESIGKRIEVNGTNSLLNLLRDNLVLFRAKYPQIDLNVVGGDSGEAIEDLINGKSNLASSSKIPSADDRRRAIKNNRPIADHKIALDSVVVFTHKSNPVKLISVDQLKQIYSGKLMTWRELDYVGSKEKITRFSLSKQSGTYAFFSDRVMFLEPMLSDVIHVYNPIQMIDLVAADPNAIGFASLSAVKGSSLVKIIKISSVFDERGSSPLDAGGEVDFNAIKRGEYPLTRYLYLVTAGPIADEVAKVIDFMRSEMAQSKLPDYGLVGIL